MIVAVWITCAAVLGLIAGTLAVVPMAMEQQVAPEIIPLLFTAIAVSVSLTAAFLVRMIPAVARAYSLARLILAGCVAWPLAWWLGIQTKDALQAAGSHGIFAISATITHMAVGGLGVAIAAMVILAQRTEATPRRTADA
jgi:hypothetical protein